MFSYTVLYNATSRRTHCMHPLTRRALFKPPVPTVHNHVVNASSIFFNYKILCIKIYI